jgi:hypothetical protein
MCRVEGTKGVLEGIERRNAVGRLDNLCEVEALARTRQRLVGKIGHLAGGVALCPQQAQRMMSGPIIASSAASP